MHDNNSSSTTRHPQESSKRGEIIYVDPMPAQRVAAERMTQAQTTIPMFHLSTTVTMDGALKVLAQHKKESSEGEADPTVGVLILKATAMLLKEHPLVNGSYRDGSFEIYSRVNVGFAVPTDRGLLVPTVFDADRLSIDEIAQEVKRLITQARNGAITFSELSGATFTISNLGVFDIEAFTAIINPPQAAILATGRIARRAVVGDDDLIASRQQMTMTLGCDHRILQGSDGATFLQDLQSLLENRPALWGPAGQKVLREPLGGLG